MEKPKRPMTAFLLWLNSVRDQIKAEHPGIKVTEVSKLGGEMWRNMENKSEWIEKAAKAKEQYVKDLASYYNKRGGGESVSPYSSASEYSESSSSDGREGRK